MEALKINQLEVENVKRIKAVKVEPTANGLTIIGGNNNQGKTSVLDSIGLGAGRGPLPALSGHKRRFPDSSYLAYCHEQWAGSGTQGQEQ